MLARTVADAALLLDVASGNARGDLHKPTPVRLTDHAHAAPGPCRIATVAEVPVHRVPRPPASRDLTRRSNNVADQLEAMGHTIMAGDPSYGLRLGRSFPGPLDGRAPRTGPTVSVTASRSIRGPSPTCGSVGCCRDGRCSRRAGDEAIAARRSARIFNHVDVVLAPTTALPPPRVRAFDDLGSFRTDRTMITYCPVTWPWNVLGWPSINVPAGFTTDGLPIGVQLMGPANSEPLLVSLAAELEGVNGWAEKQPDVWWNTPQVRVSA